MNFREEAKTLVIDIPNITRRSFIAKMVVIGASMHTASLYYHKYVHVPRKVKMHETLIAETGRPQRDARGRFIKKVA